MELIREHYAKLRSEHGNTPRGIGWRDRAAHLDRLLALSLVFAGDSGYSLNDWGCGYGSMIEYADGCADYRGYDLVANPLPMGEFILSEKPTKIADYTVASGIFNVMDRPREAWMDYVKECFGVMDKMSRRGYAFNLLHARADRKEEGLFYTTPAWVLTHLPNYERVSVLQHYSPWDFSILVTK